MRLLIVIFILLVLTGICYADRFEYSAPINQYIPEADSAGIRDTIFIPVHAPISDINFYVGVGLPNQPWGEVIIIDVYSPNRTMVKLNEASINPFFWFNVWYDTEREEDGPGHLEDYAGGDAYGPWEMHCYDPYQGQSLTWYTWGIELYTTTESVNEQAQRPTEFAINGAYPNPFNSSVKIEYSLAEQSSVTLEVYDITGRKVSTLVNSKSLEPGYYQTVWDGKTENGKTASSGVYLFRLVAGEHQANFKATMLK